MFANMRGMELLIILGIVILLFGARKLPDLARSVGQSLHEFRKGVRADSSPDEAASGENPTV